MRIIAGEFSGRQIATPSGHRTHPMSEKVRGAIFNMLGDIEGLTVLDAFSGSGALSLEAISRGAKSVQAIEADKKAHQTIVRNIVAFDLSDKVKVTKAFSGSWSTRHESAKFDVVLLDPPFNQPPFRDLKRMPRHLKNKGILVLSWPSKADWYPFIGLKLVKSKHYGDSALHYYKQV